MSSRVLAVLLAASFTDGYSRTAEVSFRLDRAEVHVPVTGQKGACHRAIVKLDQARLATGVKLSGVSLPGVSIGFSGSPAQRSFDLGCGRLGPTKTELYIDFEGVSGKPGTGTGTIELWERIPNKAEVAKNARDELQYDLDDAEQECRSGKYSAQACACVRGFSTCKSLGKGGCAEEFRDCFNFPRN